MNGLLLLMLFFSALFIDRHSKHCLAAFTTWDTLLCALFKCFKCSGIFCVVQIDCVIFAISQISDSRWNMCSQTVWTWFSFSYLLLLSDVRWVLMKCVLALCYWCMMNPQLCDCVSIGFGWQDVSQCEIWLNMDRLNEFVRVILDSNSDDISISRFIVVGHTNENQWIVSIECTSTRRSYTFFLLSSSTLWHLMKAWCSSCIAVCGSTIMCIWLESIPYEIVYALWAWPFLGAITGITWSWNMWMRNINLMAAKQKQKSLENVILVALEILISNLNSVSAADSHDHHRTHTDVA